VPGETLRGKRSVNRCDRFVTVHFDVSRQSLEVLIRIRVGTEVPLSLGIGTVQCPPAGGFSKAGVGELTFGSLSDSTFHAGRSLNGLHRHGLHLCLRCGKLFGQRLQLSGLAFHQILQACNFQRGDVPLGLGFHLD